MKEEEEAQRSEWAHFVYVMARSADGGIAAPIKVGVTSDLLGRERAIQTGCPHRIELVYALGLNNRLTALGLEKAFHLSNADRRVSGEWFDMEPLRAVRWLLLEYVFESRSGHIFGVPTLNRLNDGPDDVELTTRVIEHLDAAR